jgi:hypothetical protein
MSEVRTFNFRVWPQHAAKVSELSEQTGMSTSQVMHSLIENARLELHPIPSATITVSANSNNDVNSLAGSHVAVAV